jgi:hypothetical protein
VACVSRASSRAGTLRAFEDPDIKAAMARQENIIDPSTPEAARQTFQCDQDRHARSV